MKRRPAVSNTEFEVLEALWEQGPGTVRELADLLRARRRRWAYTTVQTLLNRLETKGYVTRDRGGVAHVFRAAVTRQKLLGQRLKELAGQFCDGTATPLVMALIEEGDLSETDIAEFRELLERLDKGDTSTEP